MRNLIAKKIALGGMLAAVCIVIMCLGGMIPIATYVCPMLCAIGQWAVLHLCGKRIAWAWYVSVAFLSVILGPDKEAAIIFVCLGYYPIIKPAIEKSRFGIIWKLLLFNGIILLLYTILLHAFGLHEIVQDYRELGLLAAVIMVVLGNVTFLLLDRMLTMFEKGKFIKHGR